MFYFVSVNVLKHFFSRIMLQSTVPTFNSCNKCVGSPGIIHDCSPDYHPVSYAWVHGDLTTERIYVSYVGH